MFTISIDPIIFYIGTFGVRWYHATEVLSIIVVLTMIFIESRRLGIPLKHIYSLFVIIVIVGLILAKVTDIIGRPAVYAEYPEKIFSLGGMRAAGVIISCFIVLPIYCWRAKLSFWQIGDAMAPGFAIAMAIFRIGCLLNGCCHGLECPIPWLSIIYSGENTLAPMDVPLYPVQFFKIMQGVIIFIILWLLRKQLKPSGSVLLLSLILFSSGDLIIRLFRQPDAVIAGVQIQQIVNIILLIVTIPLYIIRRKRYLLSVR